jgi:hypothetical protein
MASLWTLGGTDLYVSAHASKSDIKLAKLTPLDSSNSSTLHFFGSGAKEISIKGLIASDTNKDAIETAYNAGTTVALTSHRGSEGNFKIKEASFNERGFVRLSLPGYPDEPDEVSLYDFQIELIKV